MPKAAKRPGLTQALDHPENFLRLLIFLLATIPTMALATQREAALEPAPVDFVSANPACEAHLTTATPVYPPALARSPKPGWVALSYNIVDGVPTDIKVEDASPRRIFNQSAINALSQTRFPPEPSRVAGCKRVIEYKFV